MKPLEMLALIAPHAALCAELAQQSSAKSWVLQRHFSLGRSELSEQLSPLAQPALWLPSLEQAMFPFPNALCIPVSTSSAP